METNKTKREPLMRDIRLWYRNNQGDMEQLEGHEVRKFYEAKIDDGTLMIVKTTMREMDYDFMDCCMLCKRELSCDDTFCPGCGALIVEQ